MIDGYYYWVKLQTPTGVVTKWKPALYCPDLLGRDIANWQVLGQQGFLENVYEVGELIEYPMEKR